MEHDNLVTGNNQAQGELGELKTLRSFYSVVAKSFIE